MDKPIVRIFGVPMDLGQTRRGVDMGPSAMRYANLDEQLHRLGYDVHDEGNVIVAQAEEILDPARAGETPVNAHYLPEVARACQAAYDQITGCLEPDEYAIFIGGDHSISIGTVAAVAQFERTGVLWIDAHADFNTPETSPSGSIHGMVLAALVGDGPLPLTRVGGITPVLDPAQIAMVGVRDVDPDERERIASHDLTVFTMPAVDEQGIHHVARKILDQFADTERIHVSLDLDSCDPRIAPGVGTPVRGGLSYREAHLLMEILAESGKVRTVDVVEINPILDDRNSTAEIAVELVASLFGLRII